MCRVPMALREAISVESNLKANWGGETHPIPSVRNGFFSVPLLPSRFRNPQPFYRCPPLDDLLLASRSGSLLHFLGLADCPFHKVNFNG